MDQTSWEAAENEIREWIRSGRIGGGTEKPTTVSDAVAMYLADAAARNLRPGTIRLHKILLKDSFLPWTEEKGLRYLKHIDLKAMIEYRSEWKYAPMTALKKFERLRSFFLFCKRAGWIVESPLAAMRLPKVDTPPTMPFDEHEMARIFAACEGFKIRGSYGKNNPTRVLAFVYVLRYAGLRISDAVGLEKSRLSSDGKLFLHQQFKTKVPVFVPLPPFAVQALREQDAITGNRPYFFWGNEGKLESAVSSWKRTLYRIFDIAEVKDGHAHRFRDTFAVELLLNDVPLESVSQLLGHRSSKVTEQSYSPWVKARQDKLEAAVQKTWKKPTTLKLVKKAEAR
jgi:integrase